MTTATLDAPAPLETPVGCSAAVHGTDNAYRNRGCRCADARAAAAAARQQQRQATAAQTPPQLVDATGPRRMVQGMARMGWSPEAIARTTGLHYNSVDLLGRGRIAQVRPATAAAIRGAYDRLAMRVGPHRRTARLAEMDGWAPPLAWDDEEIGDPAASPHLGEPDSESDEIDEVAVRRAVAGHPVVLTRRERLAAAKIMWHDPDLTKAEIGARFGLTGHAVEDWAREEGWPRRMGDRSIGPPRKAASRRIGRSPQTGDNSSSGT